MDASKILEDLKDAIVELNDKKAVETAKMLIAKGIDPLEGVEKGLSLGMGIVGDKFNREEVYLPELMRAGNTFNAAIRVLEPEIIKRKSKKSRQGVAVIGTVKGDVHKIGKDIYSMLLKTRGFDVFDLGEDVSMTAFVEKAEEVDADIIGMSSLLTTTMPAQKEVIDYLKEKGIREKYIVMVGGGPVSQAWADEIGADGYAETAEKGVRIGVELISLKK